MEDIEINIKNGIMSRVYSLRDSKLRAAFTNVEVNYCPFVNEIYNLISIKPIVNRKSKIVNGFIVNRKSKIANNFSIKPIVNLKSKIVNNFIVNRKSKIVNNFVENFVENFFATPLQNQINSLLSRKCNPARPHLLVKSFFSKTLEKAQKYNFIFDLQNNLLGTALALAPAIAKQSLTEAGRSPQAAAEKRREAIIKNIPINIYNTIRHGLKSRIFITVGHRPADGMYMDTSCKDVACNVSTITTQNRPKNGFLPKVGMTVAVCGWDGFGGFVSETSSSNFKKIKNIT